ncbi:MAG: phage tail tape measure protein [Hyphomicrobiaceae bacterium]|nr:MAG: phage tail tape measure protein [Hyphomicrobiaceae bacterium]
MQKVEVEIGAKDTGSMSAWKRQEYAINGIIEQLGKLEAKQKQGALQQEGMLSKSISKVSQWATGLVSVQGAVSGITAAFAATGREIDAVSLKYDDYFRRLQVQAALNDLQATEAKTGVLNVAQKYGFTAEETAAAATQLVSSGFSAKDATGEALDVFIKGAAASNLQGQDTTELAQAVSQLLNSQGAKLNAENLKVVMQGTQRLFEANNIQLSDLSQLAGKGLSYKGRASVPELLGMMTVGKDVLGADTAATGIKIFGERLMGAKGDVQREKVLGAMGMKPEDVDMIGENVGDVLDRLADGMSRLKPEERAGQLQKLFGTEAAGFASLMIDSRAKLSGLVAQQADEAGFTAAAERATTGKGAGRRRAQVMKDRRLDQYDSDFQTRLDIAEEIAITQGGRPEAAGVRRAAAEQAAPFVGRERAIALAYSGAGYTSGIAGLGNMGAFMEKLDKTFERVIASSEKQTEELRDIKKNTAKAPIKVEKPHVPRTPVSAMAGTGGR